MTESHSAGPNHAAAPLSIVVLASGTGSLLQSMLDTLDAARVRVAAVGSDKDCEALKRAEAAGIPSFQVPFDAAARADRAGWDATLLAAVREHRPDFVVSAGFMRILGQGFIDAFPDRIVNTHPALLPSFPGAHAVPDALAYGVKVTGSTVHLVDGGVDTGPVLAQEAVPVLEDDDVASLHERIKVVERRLLAEVVAAVATRGVVSDGRKAVIPGDRT